MVLWSDTGEPWAEREAQPLEEVEYVHAGQIAAATRPCAITMVLGSCVSVCLHDPRLRAGGANHYLLPLTVVGAQATPRFGDVAIEALLERMLALGCRRGDLVAKVFGGACTVAGTSGKSLGMQNVEVARRVLRALRIRVVAEDVGGDRGRKLVFHTHEGFVWIRGL
jgi:chemotaxis protein CheD